MRAGIAILAVLLVTPALGSGTAAAQAVRGVVTMADGTTRASGVIVTAAGDSGAEARALTNQRGEFAIVAPRPGRYTLRALRVGFRPTPGPVVTLAAGETADVRITLTDVAVSLRAVTVQGDDVCRTSPDSGALVARAWEEARKAIMASQLAATDAPLVAEWIEYNRTLDPGGRIVRGLRIRSTTSPTTHAFRSAPADVLAARGYAFADSGETTYHAPDGDVLLSDSFAATHCFQVVPPARGADSLVGVSFRPARDQRDIRDIAGTFWLHRASAELRWLEFRYTNMPAVADRAAPGGRVEFQHLRTGGWIISRWSIRMPEVSRLPGTSEAGTRRVVRGPLPLTLQAIQVAGGEVSRVTRGDTVVFRGTGAALDVQVVARDRWVGAAGATVTLAGTDYAGPVNAASRLRIEPVLQGRYEARVRTPFLDSLGVPPLTREIDVTARARTDTVRLPSGDDVLAIACRDSLADGGSLMRGIVRDTTGRAVSNAAVTVTWQGKFRVVRDPAADRMAWTEQSVGSITDAAGRWRTCGVPREVPLVVRVRTDIGSDARRLTLEADQPFGAMDLVPHPVIVTTDHLLPKPNRAMVEFVITDEAGPLLPGVTLEVQTPDGQSRTMTVGASGRALLPDAGPGRLVVRAKKIGYRPGQLAATIAAGRNTVPIIMSVVDLPELDTVRIVGDERRATARLDEFETRRLNSAATKSLTRSEIVKRNPVSAWHMLTNVSGLRIVELGGVVRAMPTRVAQVSLLDNRPCYLKVMVDGVLWQDDPPNLTNLPAPDEIHGIEVFAGPASIPLQYGGTGKDKWCGLIAVWTR